MDPKVEERYESTAKFDKHAPDHFISHGERTGGGPTGPYDYYTGELWPGALGWLPIDELGVPIGAATLEPPPKGTLACRVYRNLEPGPVGHSDLVTPAGAELIPALNPSPDVGAETEVTPETKAERKKEWARQKAHWEKYHQPLYRTT